MYVCMYMVQILSKFIRIVWLLRDVQFRLCRVTQYSCDPAEDWRVSTTPGHGEGR